MARRDRFIERHGSARQKAALRGGSSRSGGGDGSSKKKKELTPFEKLAKARGVDLAAEQARATSQLRAGRRVGGTTPQTLALQAQPSAAQAQPSTAPQRSFQDLATDPYQQGMGVSQATPLEIEQNWAQAKIAQIREEADKPVIGFNGEPLDLRPLSPWDALALVNIPVRNPMSIFGREAPSIAATRFAAKQGTGIAANTVTKRLIKSLAAKITGKTLWRTIVGAGVGLWVTTKILELTYGGKNFGRFEGESEALQTVNIARSAAYYAGNEEAFNLADEGIKDMLYNETFWDSTESLTPHANLAVGLSKFKEKNIIADQVWDILSDEKFNPENKGLSEAELWNKAMVEHSAREKANIDYYNEQRLLTEEKIREANKDQRDEDAAFWRKEKDRLREQELADQKALADFWLEYQKMKQMLIMNNRPSNLNFGLI